MRGRDEVAIIRVGEEIIVIKKDAFSKNFKVAMMTRNDITEDRENHS